MKKIILLSFLMISNFAFSGEGSGPGKITQLYVSPNQNFIRIMFSNSNIKNPDNCGAAGYYAVELDDSNTSNRFYSALLTAFTAQKTVSFWISGCTENLLWGHTRPTTHDIYIEN